MPYINKQNIYAFGTPLKNDLNINHFNTTQANTSKTCDRGSSDYQLIPFIEITPQPTMQTGKVLRRTKNTYDPP